MTLKVSFPHVKKHPSLNVSGLQRGRNQYHLFSSAYWSVCRFTNPSPVMHVSVVCVCVCVCVCDEMSVSLYLCKRSGLLRDRAPLISYYYYYYRNLRSQHFWFKNRPVCKKCLKKEEFCEKRRRKKATTTTTTTTKKQLPTPPIALYDSSPVAHFSLSGVRHERCVLTSLEQHLEEGHGRWTSSCYPVLLFC